ncbi:hypothetical protein ACGFNU_38430 [Spirillospora sp. NPDC048911]|uniref:hypothetical protein n=1 Tax=Spirillospora sp. NPDC048911 TaxID=3364527 RepID=UPI00371DE306
MELNLRRQPPLDLAGYLQLTADRHAIIRDWLLFLSDYPLILGPVSAEPPGDRGGRELDAEENAPWPLTPLRRTIALRRMTTLRRMTVGDAVEREAP